MTPIAAVCGCPEVPFFVRSALLYLLVSSWSWKLTEPFTGKPHASGAHQFPSGLTASLLNLTFKGVRNQINIQRLSTLKEACYF